MKDLLVILVIQAFGFELYRILRGNRLRLFLKKKGYSSLRQIEIRLRLAERRLTVIELLLRPLP